MIEFKICDTCQAFGPQIDHGQDIECAVDGACRLKPPVLLPMGTPGGFASIFPPVNREDYCCSWVPKSNVEGKNDEA